MKNPLLSLRIFSGITSLLIVCTGYLVFTRISDYAAADNYQGYQLQRPSLEPDELVVSPDSGSRLEEFSLSIPDIERIFSSLPFVEEPVLEEDVRNEIVSDVNISYWVYPGNPACSALNELEMLENVDQVKPEFATINERGETVILTEDTAGCNALSSTNLEKYKSRSDSQFYTVSGSGVGFSVLMADEEKKQDSINTLVSLANQIDIDGVEIDFEGFSAWTDQEYQSYLDYLDRLGTALQQTDKKLIIDAPAIYNEGIQDVFEFRYSDFNTIAVDYVTIMAYDYQFDYGGGAAVTQDQFLRDSIEKAQEELEDDSKIIVGLPTYGYTATKDAYNDIRILTKAQTVEQLGEERVSQAVRLEDSQELLYQDGDTVYVFQDQRSINHKIGIVQEYGIDSISIWHLGGNPSL